MSSPVLIWFRLFDSKGNQWPKTTAAKVSVNYSADVDDFRKAILKMYNDEGSTILTGISSSQLLVYRDKQALQDKEEPLEVDSSIVGLGVNKEKDALIVVAPSTISSVGDLLQEIKTILHEQQEQQQKLLNERLNEQQEQQQKLLNERLNEQQEQQQKLLNERLNEQQEQQQKQRQEIKTIRKQQEQQQKFLKESLNEQRQEIKTIRKQQEQQQKFLKKSLNEQQEQRQEIKTIRKQQEQQQKTLNQVDHNIADLKHKPTKSYTFTVIGKREIERLEKDKLVFKMEPKQNEEAFWSEEIQNQVNAITKEDVFTAFITPYFSAILQQFNLVFVNSENHKWLPQSSDLHNCTYLKPDGFATHRGMFRAKSVVNRHEDEFLYGIAEKDLFDCLIIFESKMNITDKAFGQVKHYLELLQPENTSAAILFDLTSFWLIKNHKSSVVRIDISKWTDKGSKSLFEKFISENVSPWVSYLTNACNRLKVNVVVGDSYLGCGAFGRVFKVDKGGQTFALKVVEETSASRLEREREAMQCVMSTGLTASIVEASIEATGCAALLLSPVGAPLPYPKKEEEVQRLFQHLWMLHDRNVIHGDPRVPNVILHEGKLLWIDLVGVRKTCASMVRDDVTLLTKSILRIRGQDKLEITLQDLITKYVENQTKENIKSLAEEVSKHLPKELSTNKRQRRTTSSTSSVVESHSISNVEITSIDGEQA
jgi:tRNA A-37 threonylcarbamoyl transferase component Bud32